MSLLECLEPGMIVNFPQAFDDSVTPASVKDEVNVPSRKARATLGHAQAEFRWLPYAPGAIAYYEGNDEIVSGPFSGCFLAAYRVKTAKNTFVRRVAHISTGGPSDCKDPFRRLFYPQMRISKSKGPREKPSKYTLLSLARPFEPRRDALTKATKILGIVARDNSIHVVYLGKIQKDTTQEKHVKRGKMSNDFEISSPNGPAIQETEYQVLSIKHLPNNPLG